MSTRTRPNKMEREERFRAAFTRLMKIAAARGKPTLYYVPMGRWRGQYSYTVLAINEDGEIEDVGRYVHWLTDLKLKKDTSLIVSLYASDISEAVNREFEKAGFDKETFRGFTL